MKKVRRNSFALFLCLLSLSVLETSVPRAEAALSADCESRMLTELGTLLKEDEGDILATQFQLTSLKLALTLNRAGEKTFESWLKKENGKLAKADRKDIRSKLEKLYEKYGEGADRKAFLAKMKGADYFKLPLRFTNAEVSVYLRAHTALEKESPFTRLDAAAVWAQRRISESLTRSHGRGSKDANLSEISTVAASYTGMMKGLAKKSDAELSAAIAKYSADVLQKFDDLTSRFSTALKRDCQQCSDCGLSDSKKEGLLADLFEKTEGAVAVEEAKEEKTEIMRMNAVIEKKTAPEASRVVLENQEESEADTTTNAATPVVTTAAALDTATSSPLASPSTVPQRKPKKVKIGPPEYEEDEDAAPAPARAESTVKPLWTAASAKVLHAKLAADFNANPANRAANINRYRDGRLSSYLRYEDYPAVNRKGISQGDLRVQAQPIPSNMVRKIRSPQPPSEKALRRALEGYEKALASGQYPNLKRNVITLIDFDQPSDARRLYVLDLENGKVLLNTYTTHGGLETFDNDPKRMPKRFSAKKGDVYSQTGFYVTGSRAGKDALTLHHLDSNFRHTENERTVEFRRNVALQVRTYFSGGQAQSRDGSFGLPFFESGKFYGLEDRPLSDLVIEQVAGESLVYVHSSRN